MRVAYACEANTWGPRRRASSFEADGWTAVGSGQKLDLLGSMKWRSVRWCEGSPLEGFEVVVGDPSVVVLAPPETMTVAVAIGAQDPRGSCGATREPDYIWDCERFPLHPWGGRTDWESRGEVRARIGAEGPTIGVLPISWAPYVLPALADGAAPSGSQVFVTSNPEDLVGVDLAVVAAGWAPVLEAAASGVPYVAVNLGRRDHPLRASGTVEECAVMIRELGGTEANLPDDLVPMLPDFRPSFRSEVEKLFEEWSS